MTFDKNSGLVKVWVSMVQKGTYTVDQIPTMYNLKEIVTEILDEQAAEAA